MTAAVVLMAYGSPERIEDVPAYYADIRGGRPVRPELIAELTERYRRLGIEDSNPLNEITERTRAALEVELGLPVLTGMKHWTPRIADAADCRRRGRRGRDTRGARRRARPRPALLAALDRGLPRAARPGARRARRARLRRELARRPRPRRAVGGTAPRDRPARHLHRPQSPRPHPRRRRSLPGPAAPDVPPGRGVRGTPGVVVQLPVGVPDGRAVAPARHPRPPRRAPRARRR
jgi:Ferrochelatase